MLKSIDVVRNALRILRAAITRGDKQNTNTESLELKTQRSCEYEFRSSGAVLISLPRKPLRGNSPAAGSPGDLSINVLGQVHFPEDAPPANASRSLTCSWKTRLRHIPGQDMLVAGMSAASHRWETKDEAPK